MHKASDLLRGRAANLIVSDPWDFANDDGSTLFFVQIVSVDSYADGAERERALILLEKPFNWHGLFVYYLVVEERHGHGMIDDLLEGRPVECNAVAVSAEQVAEGSPWGADRWRGGLAAIARLGLQET